MQQQNLIGKRRGTKRMLWKYGSTIYSVAQRATLFRMHIISKRGWRNSDGLRLRSYSCHRPGPLCAHTRLSRGDEFRATFVGPSCYFRPSGMCVCRRRFAVSAPVPPAVPAQLNNGRAWRLRLRYVCHVRPILTVSPPSITADPPSIHPGDRASLLRPSPSIAE